MAWTTPTTRSNSEFLDASDWNTDVKANLEYILGIIRPSVLTNKSGSSLDIGSVVIQDGSNDSSFTTTATANKTNVIGILAEAIGDNQTGQVSITGLVLVLVQGNVTLGNYLATSTTAARAQDAGSIQTNATFAIAMTAYSGGGAGSVVAMLLNSFSQEVQPSNSISWISSSVPNGYTEYTNARGRVIVGLPSGGTMEGTVANALTDLSTVSHRHSIDTLAHTHGFEVSTGGGGSSSGIYRGGGGGSSGTCTFFDLEPDSGGGFTQYSTHTLPYIQLLCIQKD